MVHWTFLWENNSECLRENKAEESNAIMERWGGVGGNWEHTGIRINVGICHGYLSTELTCNRDLAIKSMFIF